MGALIFRIGWGAHYTVILIRSHQNSIGNYLGPYIKPQILNPKPQPVPLLLLVSAWKPAGSLAGYTGNCHKHRLFEKPCIIYSHYGALYLGSSKETLNLDNHPIRYYHTWRWATPNPNTLTSR